MQNGSAVVGRGAAHHLRADHEQAGIIAGHFQHDMASVEDGVVGAADGDQVVLSRHGGQRRAAGAPANPVEIEVQFVKLMQGCLQRSGDHLKRAGHARRAGNEQHKFVRRHTRVGCERPTDIIGRKFRRLEQADHGVCPLPHADLVIESFTADCRSDRPAGHREVARRAHLPARIL